MSLLKQISMPISQVVHVDTKSAKPPSPDPYFYKKFPSGATIGKTDESDQSGRPFLGYRNPGDDATTTDRTRVAVTFDPTIAQPLTKEQYYNPRAVEDRAKIRNMLGADHSDELDHALALTVGGSNDLSNLRVIPGRVNQKYGKYEADLARKLVAGEIAYLDAQILEAKNKKIDMPWMPPDLKKDDPTVWNKFKSTVQKYLKQKSDAPEDTPQKSAYTSLLQGVGVVK